ncbi:MAG: 2-phosphosulfolactate phosphatase [Actinobacteria bacterium]|nr:2-phosphosulfolactate phosphatase [Actinomycetota bacterium]
MDQKLNVYALPSLVTEEELAGRTVVVIDVLRASTTIAYALEAGAEVVLPCEEIQEAQRIADGLPPGEVVLGGERGGLPIEGFDLGNSPSEYTPEVVAGKSVVFTTTNGTRAMRHCRQAARVLIGSFGNATAVYDQLLTQDEIHIVCAGTRGQYSRDDILMAGLLVERLERNGAGRYEMNVQAVTAKENWTSSFAVPFVIGAEPMDPEVLAAELRRSEAGRTLTAIGQERDILIASLVDCFSQVPVLNTETMRICYE